eukprot:4661851-Pyramimonas_sp.AAC.1
MVELDEGPLLGLCLLDGLDFAHILAAWLARAATEGVRLVSQGTLNPICCHSSRRRGSLVPDRWGRELSHLADSLDGQVRWAPLPPSSHL